MGGRIVKTVWDGHVYSAVFRTNYKILLHSTGNTSQCPVTDRMGGEFGGEWIHAYVWLCALAVHLKLSISKHCYSIVLLQYQLYSNTKSKV